MPGISKIEWTDASWNPVTGCTKVSAGCKFCYAERLFKRPYPGRAFSDVQVHPERLEWPLHRRKPLKIFVNSISDLFHESVPDNFLWQGLGSSVFETMWNAWWHTFQILTKRADRMLAWAGPMGAMGIINKNVWLGVSVEDQKTADERIPLLLQTPAAVRWVSYEPALGPVDLGGYICGHDCEDFGLCQMNPQPPGKPDCTCPRLDWVVAGGESGPHARPSHPDWFRSVRDQCQAAGVPFFFKQWGEWAHSSQLSQPELDEVMVWLQTQGNPWKNLYTWADGTSSVKVGKKRAGRMLDGKECSEFPQADK